LASIFLAFPMGLVLRFISESEISKRFASLRLNDKRPKEISLSYDRPLSKPNKKTKQKVSLALVRLIVSGYIVRCDLFFLDEKEKNRTAILFFL
jgi:hypothetical protein